MGALVTEADDLLWLASLYHNEKAMVGVRVSYKPLGPRCAQNFNEYIAQAFGGGGGGEMESHVVVLVALLVVMRGPKQNRIENCEGETGQREFRNAAMCATRILHALLFILDRETTNVVAALPQRYNAVARYAYHTSFPSLPAAPNYRYHGAILR